MDATKGFALVAVTTLSIVIIILIALGHGRPHLHVTPLAVLALGCVTAGVVLGDDRGLGYSLLGSGVVFAVVDALLRSRRDS